ncbi:DMT family transporter [Dapis sp. BLCC M229]|uniref:DMT family transporter n=1 Tax=Dapis sp. BLCC M229 TaxID=3400188 RepID=UPI003CF55990
MTNKLQLQSQQLEKKGPTSIASLFVALLAISSSAIFIRLSEGEISSNATVFDRVAIATVIFGLWNSVNAVRYRLSDQKPVEQKLDISQDLWLLLAMATFYITSQGLWAWSLSQTTVAISTVLISLKPLFTCLFAWLAWGQRFDNKFLIGMIIAMVGAGSIGLEDLQIDTGKVEGDIAAFLAGICSAAYLLTVEKLRTKFAPTTIIPWCCGLGTLLSLPILFFSEDRFFPYSVNGWVFVISLAIVGQVLGQGLLAYSLKKFSSGFVALVLLLESILVAIAAWAIFGEALTLFNWVALFAILLGLYLAVSSQSAVKE